MPEVRDTSGNQKCSRPGRGTGAQGALPDNTDMGPNFRSSVNLGQAGTQEVVCVPGDSNVPPGSEPLFPPARSESHQQAESRFRVKGEGRCPNAGACQCWAPVGQGSHLPPLSLDEVKGKCSQVFPERNPH